MVVSNPKGINGVHMTWGAWLQSKVDMSKCVIPIAAMISPIHPHLNIPTLPYVPLRCRTCSCLLNPYCQVDSNAKIWTFPFYFPMQTFPHHYSMISETNVPTEIYPQYTTVEYALVGPNLDAIAVPAIPPALLFVLNTCILEEELGFAKSTMKQAIGLLLDNALVRFISFGMQVQVHELGFSNLMKVYVFCGSKDISKE